MRHQYTLIVMATIENTEHTNIGEGMGELELSYTTHENRKMVKSLW